MEFVVIRCVDEQLCYINAYNVTGSRLYPPPAPAGSRSVAEVITAISELALPLPSLFFLSSCRGQANWMKYSTSDVLVCRGGRVGVEQGERTGGG